MAKKNTTGSIAALSRKDKRKLFAPGYWGYLEDAELEYILAELHQKPKLSHAWGFRPTQQSRSAEAIRRVAMWGDPEDREANVKLVRGKSIGNTSGKLGGKSGGNTRGDGAMLQ